MVQGSDGFVTYICVAKHHEINETRAIRIGPDREEIEPWRDRQKGHLNKNSTKKSSHEDDKSDRDAEKSSLENGDFESIVMNFVESMSGYQPLSLLSTVLMPISKSSYIKGEIVDKAGEDFPILEDDGEFLTLGVYEQNLPSVNKHISRLREYDQAHRALPGAILLSLVATFDSYIADTLRLTLRAHPERYQGSDYKISLKDILEMATFDDAIDKVVEEQVDNIMRGSHDEQIAFVEKEFGLSIRENYDEWGDFIEIFERRNLAAHGALIVNRHYMRNCHKSGYDISEITEGDKLELTSKYIRRSADRLLEVGLLLMFTLWRKQHPEQNSSAYRALNDIALDMIKENRSIVASRLLGFALQQKKKGIEDSIIKMMTVNLANAYKKSKKAEKAQQVLDGVDWSAASDDFKICVAAVRGDAEQVASMIPQVARSGSVEKADFRDWPVFDWVREDENVQESFFVAFGELLNAPEEEADKTIEENDKNDDDAEIFE